MSDRSPCPCQIEKNRSDTGFPCQIGLPVSRVRSRKTDLTRESRVRSVSPVSPCQIEKNRSDTGFPCQICIPVSRVRLRKTDLTRDSRVRLVISCFSLSDTGIPCQIEKNRSDTGFPCQNGHKQEVLDLGSTGNGKRITMQSRDQTDSVHHAKRSIQ